MSDKIVSIKQRLINLQNPVFLARFLLIAIFKNEQKIVSRITSRIFKGKQADGKAIKPIDKPYKKYSPQYERFKRSEGLYQGHIDWSLTGEYLKSVGLKTDKKHLWIEGTKEVNGKSLSEILEKLYGNGVEMIGKQDLAYLLSVIQDDFLREVRRYLLV